MSKILKRLIDSKLWNCIRSNELIYSFFHRAIGLKLQASFDRARIRAIKRYGMNTIFDIDKILSEHDVRYFVDFGTLLGLVRSGGLLPWDCDIDFGIKISRIFKWKDLQIVLENKGYKLSRYFSYNGIITEQTYQKGNVFVDFFSHFDDEEYSKYYVYYRKNGFIYESNNRMHARMVSTIRIDSTEDLKISNGKIPVPKQYEQYLCDVYGADWRIPDPEWKGKEDLPNVVYLTELGEMTEVE